MVLRAGTRYEIGACRQSTGTDQRSGASPSTEIVSLGFSSVQVELSELGVPLMPHTRPQHADNYYAAQKLILMQQHELRHHALMIVFLRLLLEYKK